MTFTRVGGGRNPPLLSPGDVLRVETNFETRSALVLAVESCWVSSQRDHDGSAAAGDLYLISRGCPMPNVTMVSTAGSNPSFTVTVTDSFLPLRRGFYLFCQIGLCTPAGLATEGNVGTVRHS